MPVDRPIWSLRRGLVGPWQSFAAVGAATLACACDVDPETARRQWIQQTLIHDNQALLEREPDLTQGKFAKMAASPYAYFRGTAPQFARDFTEPGSPGHIPTAFLDGSTADVALVGDPHPENVGSTQRIDDVVVVEFNDFDGATYGPYISDVRRLALGYWVACEQTRASLPDDAINPISAEHCAEAVAQVGRGYADHMASLKSGGLPLELAEGGSYGTIIDELLEKGRERGDERRRLATYTSVDDNVRSMVFAQNDPPTTVNVGGRLFDIIGDETRPPTDDEQIWVDGLMKRYGDSLEPRVDPSELEVLGVSRRLGAGVSSYPVLRLYVLLRGPTDAVSDDILVEAKQILDPLAFPGVPRYPSPGATDNAARVVAFQRSMQEGNGDRWLGGSTAGDTMSIKVRHRTGYQRGFGVEDLEASLTDGDWAPEDFIVYARTVGALLARVHGRGQTQSGRSGVGVIAPLLEGRALEFVDELSAFVAVYGPRTLQDHALFRELVALEGYALGYRSTTP